MYRESFLATIVRVLTKTRWLIHSKKGVGIKKPSGL